MNLALMAKVLQEVTTSCSMGCITPENKAVSDFGAPALLSVEVDD